VKNYLKADNNNVEETKWHYTSRSLTCRPGTGPTCGDSTAVDSVPSLDQQPPKVKSDIMIKDRITKE
jgi:hypothetical protein